MNLGKFGVVYPQVDDIATIINTFGFSCHVAKVYHSR